MIVSSIAADSTAVYYAAIDLRTFDRMIFRVAPEHSRLCSSQQSLRTLCASSVISCTT